MKKIISLFLCALLFVTAVPFTASAVVWDGSASSGFEKGSGSEDDPYLISSASEFAYLFAQLDLGGEDFSGKYFELTNNIVFNDETFEFQPDTGLVKVTDGENVIFFGTGIRGDKSGENETFDEAASNSSYIYTSDNSTESVHYYEHSETYSGELYFLHSAIWVNGNKAFKGHLDGNGYIVEGFLASGDSSTGAGLFVTANEATIKNLRIENSFVFGSGSGGLVGYAEATEFYNCTFDGIILSGGGIVNKALNCNFNLCKNEGLIIGGSSGGIVSNNSADSAEYSITDCENRGNIINENNVGICGGIVGSNSIATVYDCTNRGIVINNALSNTNLFGTGGIVGSADDCEVVKCMNFGSVSGLKYVGGIVGNADQANVSDSVNHNIVKGESIVGGIIGFLGVGTTAEIKIEGNYNDNAVVGNSSAGGIIGWAVSHNSLDITNNFNEGYISGGSGVGGILGALNSNKGCTTLSYCANINEVVADGDRIGGIIGSANAVDGSVIIEKSYNSATIEGVGNVGGLVGEYKLNEFDGTILIENTYNSGDIYGVNNIGGFVGGVSRNLGIGAPLDIKTSYTIGDIFVSGDDAETESKGILLGFSNCQINTVDCYYSINIQIESEYGNTTKISDDATGLSLSDMTKAESFVGFDFKSIWEINSDEDYKYPTLIDLEHINHAHYIYMECDDEYHWYLCNCGYTTPKEAHYGEWEEWIDGERLKYCEKCRLLIGHEVQKGMLGDINDDKEINQYDYILAKRIHFNTYTPDDGQKLRGDVNKDGSNNQYDYILIKRHHFKNYTITG